MNRKDLLGAVAPALDRGSAVESAGRRTRAWLRQLPGLLAELERVCCAAWECCASLAMPRAEKGACTDRCEEAGVTAR